MAGVAGAAAAYYAYHWWAIRRPPPPRPGSTDPTSLSDPAFQAAHSSGASAGGMRQQASRKKSIKGMDARLGAFLIACTFDARPRMPQHSTEPCRVIRNPHWPAGRHDGAAVSRDDADGDPAADSQASGSEPSPDAAAAARLADDYAAAAEGGASVAPGRPDEAAEMATHFQRVQELFGGGSEHQVAALARQLRTAVDVESVRARLQ